MKIIKIPITEQNREVYWSRNKDKKAWEKLMSECPYQGNEHLLGTNKSK